MTFPYHPWPLSMSFASCFADEFLFLFVNMCWMFSLSSMISKSHFSFYLLSFLSLSPIQAHKYLFFFCYFKLFLWLIFPSLFVLFLQIDHPTNSTHQIEEPRQMVSSDHSIDNGWESVHPTWVSQVTIWPQTQSTRPLESPTPWAHQKSNLSNLERKWGRKKSFIPEDNFDPLSPNTFFFFFFFCVWSLLLSCFN